MKIIKRDPHVFGISENEKVSDDDIQALIELFKKPATDSTGTLGGRGKISRITLKENVPAIIKYYRRGGLVRHLVKQAYLKVGKTRCEVEFEMLAAAKKAGISVPTPIAWAYHGRLIYKGWLVVKELEESISLADYCLENQNNFDLVLSKTIEQIKLLIENKILHVDLHPGNILISNNQVYIIDFDKAKFTNMNSKVLANLYIARWERAVIKHNLPTRLAKIKISGKNINI